jgi:hypothetical protein
MKFDQSIRKHELYTLQYRADLSLIAELQL